MDHAERMIMDPDDVSFIALALSIENEGIWTFNTTDFMRVEVTELIDILTTKDVVRAIYDRDSIDG